MSLFDDLKDFKNYKYYHQTPNINFDNLNEESSYKFIRGTYRVGCKDKIFNVGFLDSFKQNGKHIHTVILYFLGCMLEKFLNPYLKDFIGRYIKNIDWYDFKYVWYLTCLYHDTTTVIEKSDWNYRIPSDIDFHLGKYDIKHNLYEHNWEPITLKPYTYSKMLVKNYFKFRIEHRHSVDHGILSGYLLYDKLVKNYNTEWNKYCLSTSDYTPYSYKSFYWNNLSWRLEHLSLFAIVADAIIAHNTWHSKDKKIYEEYGLDPLIIPNNTKLDIKQNTLSFILGLLDTIEPTKFFDEVNILKLIDIKFESAKNEIYISMCRELPQKDKWFEKIKETEDWLSVKVNKIDDFSMSIKIL